VIRNKDGTSDSLHSKQVATHGYPMVMLSYAIDSLSLIKKIKVEFPTMHQPWYEDDAEKGAKYTHI
jgi:hypothetical protein